MLGPNHYAKPNSFEQVATAWPPAIFPLLVLGERGRFVGQQLRFSTVYNFWSKTIAKPNTFEQVAMEYGPNLDSRPLSLGKAARLAGSCGMNARL